MGSDPPASRPYMPGYGIVGPTEGSGLLPWSWAEQRLVASRNYWLASGRPDGRPHVMPVWGVWHQRSLWFSSSRGSRKARNLAADPRWWSPPWTPPCGAAPLGVRPARQGLHRLPDPLGLRAGRLSRAAATGRVSF